MAIQYRPWREGDDLELLQLWGDPESRVGEQFRGAFAPSSGTGDGDAAGAAGTGESWRQCIVAEDVVDGVSIPVAAGVVYETPLHGERLWSYIEVSRDHRGQGIGSSLLVMLRREAELSPSGVTRLRSKVAAGSAGEAFTASAGLQPIQRSRLVEVSAGSLKLPVFDGDGEDAGSDVVMDLATGSVELTQLVGKYYRSVHSWDDPGELSVGTVQRLFLDDASGAHGAIVLRAKPESAFGSTVTPTRKGRIRAFAVSYAAPLLGEGAPEVASEVFLGHDPELDADDAAEAVRDLLALIAYQHPVVLEVDDSMTAVRAAVEPLLASGGARQIGQDIRVISE
ncbi:MULTISPECIES: GNAT family N-acetyltransferase [Arthrobacter]|uniref:GNAT family N-acetyltransferase n=2 Tax=Arthrobacter TaxID=1663 RepID=A0ABU9KN36_9MICC|nr:GNAT family N-acetyltransferase [Arthrobacter sp. YJM1]MDP5228273.1 GNAT family N-acetyltransferase [Arthrobacter sp. YJM1]